MIVDPDFPSHWKSRALVAALDTEAALVCVIRLWAYCQQRRTATFKLGPKRLASICGWSGSADDLWKAMVADGEGYLDVHSDGSVTAHGFIERNRMITSKWKTEDQSEQPQNLEQDDLFLGQPDTNSNDLGVNSNDLAPKSFLSNPILSNPEDRSPRARGQTPAPGSLESIMTADDDVDRPPPDSERFEEFWAITVTKKKKAPARKAWAQAIKKATADKIIDAYRAYIPHELKAQSEGQRGQHPSSWLNAEQWDDILPQDPTVPAADTRVPTPTETKEPKFLRRKK